MERLRLDITEEDLKSIEHKDIVNATRLDRLWWRNKSVRFPTIEDRDLAIRNGQLVPVEIPNDYFTSPSEIRNDKNLQLLRPSAKRFLFGLCYDLDRLIGYSRSGHRLAVTTFYRSDEFQSNIVNSPEWYRAAKVGTSSHAAGAAFDISIRSHYSIKQDTGEMVGITTWNESVTRYQPLIFECLENIITRYVENSFCNLIIENTIEGSEYWPTCFHVCVSPTY